MPRPTTQAQLQARPKLRTRIVAEQPSTPEPVTPTAAVTDPDLAAQDGTGATLSGPGSLETRAPAIPPAVEQGGPGPDAAPRVISVQFAYEPHLRSRRPWRVSLQLGSTTIESHECAYSFARAALTRALEHIEDAAVAAYGEAKA